MNTIEEKIGEHNRRMTIIESFHPANFEDESLANNSKPRGTLDSDVRIKVLEEKVKHLIKTNK